MGGGDIFLEYAKGDDQCDHDDMPLMNVAMRSVGWIAQGRILMAGTAVFLHLLAG